MHIHSAFNKQWKKGQSSSIKQGLAEIHETIDACIFFLSDQPQIPVTLVRSLINRYIAKKAEIVAPLVNGKRGNPVLFDASTFSDLLTLNNNEGGRKIFDRHPINYLEWDDAGILLDVDTKENYEELLRME